MINDNIWARRSSLVDWEVIQIILNRMKRIFDSIILNQFSDKEWLLSEAIVDMVWIYTYFSDGDANWYFSNYIDTMVEERGNSQDAEKILRNLLEVHCKMRHQVKYKIANFLAPLLNITEPKIYHYWCALLL